MRKTSRKKINENVGAGFSLYGKSQNGLGGISRGGFGGAWNVGSSNIMYTYDIKPLNHTLEQPNTADITIINNIKIGEIISGYRINSSIVSPKDAIFTGIIKKIVKDDNGNVKYYEIYDASTNDIVKIDPTTVYVKSNSLSQYAHKTINNKLVRESLLEKFSENGDDIIKDLSIGIEAQIKQFMESIGEEYTTDNALIKCVEYGKTSFVKFLLKAGANVHANDDEALRLASQNGHKDIVELLLKAGANIHGYDEYALIMSLDNGYKDVVELLLKAGANVHTSRDYPLRLASKNGYIDGVELLLKAGANVHANNDEALRMASLKGYKGIVELLLKAGANVHIKNDEALILASKNGYEGVVELLLKAGADVHVNNDEALRRASNNGYKNIVELLLKAGADVHANNDEALRRASKNGYKDIVELLKKYMNNNSEFVKESLFEKFSEESDDLTKDLGIGIEAQIKEFMKSIEKRHYSLNDALVDCAEYGKILFVKYLLKKGADVHAYGDRALNLACANGHADIVNVLLKAGADPRVNKDEFLITASRNGHTDVVELLLRYGSNPRARKDSAIIEAAKNCHADVVEVLLKAGANVHAQHDMPQKAAVYSGCKNVINVIKKYIEENE